MEHNVADKLQLYFRVAVLLLPMLHDLHFILVLSAVCVQCPMWLFSAVLSSPSQ